MIPFNHLLSMLQRQLPMQQQGGVPDWMPPIPFEGGVPGRGKGYFNPMPFEGYGDPRRKRQQIPFNHLNPMMQYGRMPWRGMGIRQDY